MPEALVFVVPLVPPGLNHYVRHPRNGVHYVTREARAYKAAVAVCARGEFVAGETFEVEITVYLGKGASGDVDGFGKVVLDGLADAGVFRSHRRLDAFEAPERLSDAYVTDLTLRRRRDHINPRTEIRVRAL